MFAGIEGTRPLLVEIQALVAPTSLGTPRRAVVGWDQSRLSMVLAVLEAHCGVRLGGHDVYLNVAGGLRISEPAADLAAAAALVSSLADAPLPADAVYFGEVSLSGAVRPVAQAAARLKEAQKLGFARAVVPEAARGEAGADAGLALDPVGSLAEPGCRHRRDAAKSAANRRAIKTGDAAAGPAIHAVACGRRVERLDTKLNLGPMSPTLAEPSGAVEVVSKRRSIRADADPNSPQTLSDPCRSRCSTSSCSASC